jgi:hypothetical protein
MQNVKNILLKSKMSKLFLYIWDRGIWRAKVLRIMGRSFVAEPQEFISRSLCKGVIVFSEH